MTTEGWINLDGSNQAARALYKRLQAQAGLGVAQLTVHLELSSRSEVADKKPMWIGGDAYIQGVGPGNGYLGRLHTQIQPITVPERGGSCDVALTVDLSHAQVQHIENRRTGPVTLVFDLAGHWLIGGVPHRFWNVRLEVVASQSDWISMLEHMQYRRLLLIELDAIDTETTPRLGQATSFFADAQKHYLSHDWRLTVESLRQSLAALAAKPPTEEDSATVVQAELKSARNHPARASYRERYELIRQATKFLCDLGAHPETDTTTKRDAYAALLMTAGLLHAVAEP